MFRLAVALLSCLATSSSQAAMLLNFEPAGDGGVKLTASYSGVPATQVVDPRFCNVGSISGELLIGGGPERSFLRFANVIDEDVVVDGKALEVDYVRFGNDIARDSLAFYMSGNRAIAGSQVQINFVAEWRVDNLPYSLMIPGTYTGFTYPYGQAIINVAAVPEPATVFLLVTVASCGALVARRRT